MKPLAINQYSSNNGKYPRRNKYPFPDKEGWREILIPALWIIQVKFAATKIGINILGG